MSTENTIMSPEEYVAHGGDCCPCCQSEAIGGDSLDILRGVNAVQECWCLDCNAQWYDVYELAGYEPANLPI